MKGYVMAKISCVAEVAFKVKRKALIFIFKGLSVVKNGLRPKSASTIFEKIE